MNHTTIPTLDHQWDPCEVLNVQRDRRCVGWAHSKRRKCHNVVNSRDTDMFYSLLTELPAQPWDAARLQLDLRRLASFGLCKQVHRRAQVDSMVEGWTNKIETFAQTAEAQRQTRHQRFYARSTTTSYAQSETIPRPSTRTSRSSTSTISAGPASVESEIDSTLRCLEANREQERILMFRLANLQTPGAPRPDPIRPFIRTSTASVPPMPLLDNPSTASPGVLHDGVSTTSHPPASALFTPSPSTPSSSPSNLSSPRIRRRQRHTSAPSPLDTQPTASQQHAITSTPLTSSALPSATRLAPAPDYTPDTTSQHQYPAHTPPLSPVSPSTAAPAPSPSPPRCAIVHVRRLPVSDDCPICYEAMQEQTALEWCRSGCGQSVHKECMAVWRAQCVADARGVRCTMCRTEWAECAC